MDRRIVTALFVSFALGAALSAQQRSVSAKPAATRNASLTPWGEPDLQGTYTNQTLTPLERPTSLGTKATYTKEEAQALERQSEERRIANADAPPRPGDVGNYNDFWLEPGTRIVGSLQTSIVVDPSDGRVPLK